MEYYFNLLYIASYFAVILGIVYFTADTIKQIKEMFMNL